MTREEYINGTGNLIDYDQSGSVLNGVSFLGSKKSNMKLRQKFLETLTPEVESIFLKYPTEMDFFTPDSGYDLKNNYFVYEICSNDGKVIFVERSNDQSFKFNYKFDSVISFLSEYIPFSLRRLISGLNEFQAIVYIHSKIKEYVARGEYLLNHYYFDVTKPEVSRPDVTGNEPAFVFKNLALKRFLPDIYNKKEKFDVVNDETLAHITFHSKQRHEIVKWLNDSGSKITKTCTEKTRSVIVDNWIDYIKYVKYKRMGKDVLSVDDVLEYIKKHPVKNQVIQKKVRVPSYDIEVRNVIRDYLKENSKKIYEYNEYVMKHIHDIDIWIDPFKSSILKNTLPSRNIKKDLIDVIKVKILTERNPYTYSDLIKIYKKLGLFDEIVDFLSSIKDIAGAELSKYILIANSDT